MSAHSTDSPSLECTTGLYLSPGSAGAELSPEEFDTAEFQEGFRYELINGVLVVNPPPLIQERGPNDWLGYRINKFRLEHPNGRLVDYTAPEQTIVVGQKRRRADRVVWMGLGRAPRENETPAIAIELVSAGKRSIQRDYENKREEYQSIGIREYWIINRFERTLTAFAADGTKSVFVDTDLFTTDSLPGFELPLNELFAEIDWLDKRS